MLFNSLYFIVIFLPITFFLFFVISKYELSAGRVVLAIASFVFYAYWDWRFLPLLVGSIFINYIFGIGVAKFVTKNDAVTSRMLFVGGVFFNLLLLCIFKYANLLDKTSHDFFGTNIMFPAFILPIGISFFTFTQIAFLVDAYKEGIREYKFWDYALFVSYFPHQIAGPILHHKEMMSQFRSNLLTKVNLTKFSVGMSIFIIGLAKKVLLADNFANFANPVFEAVENGTPVVFFEAWCGSIAYTLQLYFDFSAYCDMAIGISLFFGIKLPANFDSPYKAKNIVEFWRRWHMTLSRFLRDYLYIPLGGNRNGKTQRYINLLVTMGLGGLWHGASWTFLAWGLLHGVYLTVNHAWQLVFRKTLSGFSDSGFYVISSWALTFVSVVIGWVFFRATTFSGALSMLGSMFGHSGVALPTQLISLNQVGFFYSSNNWLGSVGGVKAILFLLIGLNIVIFGPNIQQIFAPHSPVLNKVSLNGETRFVWSANKKWIIWLGFICGLTISRMGNESTFLYFNF